MSNSTYSFLLSLLTVITSFLNCYIVSMVQRIFNVSEGSPSSNVRIDVESIEKVTE